jgi:hypothetical protein
MSRPTNVSFKRASTAIVGVLTMALWGCDPSTFDDPSAFDPAVDELSLNNSDEDVANVDVGWNTFELAPGGSASPTSAISSVSRIPNSMELWWVGTNGSIQVAYWYDGDVWHRYELAPAGSASTAGGITAVSRIPNSLELWWIGSNGSVQASYWYEGDVPHRYELAPAGSASTISGISAVSRIPNSMEVWWVAPNGSVRDAYVYLP